MFVAKEKFKSVTPHNGGKRISIYQEGDLVPEEVAKLYPSFVKKKAKK